MYIKRAISSPIILFLAASGLAVFQHGRWSPWVVRVTNVDIYGRSGTVFVVDFPSQSVNVWKKKRKKRI